MVLTFNPESMVRIIPLSIIVLVRMGLFIWEREVNVKCHRSQITERPRMKTEIEQTDHTIKEVVPSKVRGSMADGRPIHATGPDVC